MLDVHLFPTTVLNNLPLHYPLHSDECTVYHVESENLQLIKAGTSSSDAECREKSSSVTAIVVGVLAVFLSLAVIALGVRLLYCK